MRITAKTLTIACVTVLCLIMLAATAPPPILRQILTTNAVTAGTAGQILHRVGTDGIGWSNVALLSVAGVCLGTPADNQVLTYSAVSGCWTNLDATTAGGGVSAADLQSATNTLAAAGRSELLSASNNIVALIPEGGSGDVTTAQLLSASNVLNTAIGTKQDASAYSTGTNQVAAAANANLVSASNVLQTTITAKADPVLVTNIAHATSLTFSMHRDTRASVTNTVSGDVSVLVTNILDGVYLRLRMTANGSPRTVSFYWPSGTTVTMMTTNATINSTNLYLPAGKTGIVGITGSGTNFVTVVTASSQ